jgi:hypothetical protein
MRVRDFKLYTMGVGATCRQSFTIRSERDCQISLFLSRDFGDR